MVTLTPCYRYLLARRHLVNERNREELDEVSNKRLTSMAYDVVKGLEYLAELKYVHRDIACRNCLVNSSRTVKLADFGMTRPMFESDYYRWVLGPSKDLGLVSAYFIVCTPFAQTIHLAGSDFHAA